MLWISLGLSLGAALNVYLVGPRKGITVALIWLGVAVLSAGLTFSPPFLLFVVALYITSCLCTVFEANRRWLIAGSLPFFFLGYGFVAWSTWHQIEEDRTRYPVVSLEDRLIDLREPSGQAVIDESIQQEYDYHRRLHVVFGNGQLQQLHERALVRFVNSPGFGVTRHPFSRPIREYEPISIPMPESHFRQEEYLRPGMDREWTDAHDNLDFLELNRSTQLDFANSFDFGYTPARRLVAGFVPHHYWPGRSYSRGVIYEKSKPVLPMRRLELVSLLKHEEPRVYVTDIFPRMDMLTEVPTRPLDAFEQRHLPALLDGANIRAEQSELGTRMLGSIRAVTQCIDCHDAEPGALLGAFSYELP